MTMFPERDTEVAPAGAAYSLNGNGITDAQVVPEPTVIHADTSLALAAFALAGAALALALFVYMTREVPK